VRERETRKRGRQEREDKRESGERDEIEARRERGKKRGEKRERTREASREREARRESGEREISILFCYNVGPSTSYVAEKVVRLCVKKSGWLDGA